EAQFTPGPTVALLQSSVDQRLRNVDLARRDQEADKARTSITADFIALTNVARIHHPDLIVWPETSFPADAVETAPTVPLHQLPPWWADVQQMAHEDLRLHVTTSCANVLLGINRRVLVDPKKWQFERYNSALLLYDDGKTGGRYDKIHRVPFGEY